MSGFRLLLVVMALLATSCAVGADHRFTLVGSTPCDPAIRNALSIDATTKCDFIRWNLTLDETRGNKFTLEINYGESQPNTTGFVGGGKNLAATGKFEIAKGGRDTYRLKSDPPAIDLSLAKLNTNLFHVVLQPNVTMIGNGGWSYVLNRHPAIASSQIPATMVAGLQEKAETVYIGRTPCKEIADLAGILKEADCFKLKWKLTLNRDARTYSPTTFTIESTFARDKPITGKWTSAKDSGGSIRYRLEPDALRSISLLVLDDHHLLFLDTAGRPLVGNADFSYVLDKAQ
jgi:hypothetical protein